MILSQKTSSIILFAKYILVFFLMLFMILREMSLGVGDFCTLGFVLRESALAKTFNFSMKKGLFFMPSAIIREMTNASV